MITGWTFYAPPPMPQGTLPPSRKVLPTTPAPAAGDNPPFPGTRLALLARIREAWNLPPIAAQSKSLLKQFYQPTWDVPDNPPLISALLLDRLQILQQNWQDALQARDFSIYQQLAGSPRGRRRITSPSLLPSIDNPPPYLLRRQLARLLEVHALTKVLQEGALPLLRVFPQLPPPPPLLFPESNIAFQPNAFQVGYPGPHIAFQAMNREVNLRLTEVQPFIRVIAIVGRNRSMEEYKRGDAIILSCNTFDPTARPEVLFTPERVTVNLFNPDGSLKLNAIAMTEVTRGFQSYIHQTSTDDQLGVYTGFFVAENFGHTGVSLRQALFKLVEV